MKVFSEFPISYIEWLEMPLFMFYEVPKIYKDVKEKYAEEYEKALEEIKKKNKK